MARTNIYDDKKTRWVDLINPVQTAAKFCYFFKTNVDLTEVADLGQNEVTAIPATLANPAIAGTRRPTPLVVGNAKKRITTLCSSSKFATANAAGWRRKSNPTFTTERVQNLTPTAGTPGAILVTVPVDSVGQSLLFGWFMPNAQWFRMTAAERTAMSISVPATAADWAKVVTGCNRVRPPRAKRVTFSGANNAVIGGSDTTETFYAVGSTLPAGWVHSANAIEFSL